MFDLFQTLLLIDPFCLHQNQTMVQKLSAEELHRIAESNGFVVGAHRDGDEVQQTRDPFTEQYLRSQTKSLELWKALVDCVNNVH